MFASPKILWLLLVFPPALVVFFWWSIRARKQLMQLFINARLLPGLTAGVSVPRQKVGMSLLILAVAFLILTLAGPRWGSDWEEIKLRGLDIVVAIDTSKSMLAEDIAPNRLARAKLAALDLMRLAKSDRLGLVAFAGSAFLQCPLTIDDTAFRQSVESLDVNIIPQGGTAIAEAITVAMTAFKENDNHKALVLFTDGEDHDSGALEAAQKAAASGMHIFTVGIGTTDGELLRIKDAKGRSDYIRDEQGNVVKSHLNEDLLRQLASLTDGDFYLHLTGANTMDTLYQVGLAKLPKSEHQESRVRRYHERYRWPLAAAILFLLAEMFFPERKREPRPAPAAAESLGRARTAKTAAALLLLLALPGSVFGSTSSALRDYKQGHFDKSQKEYEQLLEKNGDDPRLHFNAGAAAYRNGKFDEAAKRFDEAMQSPDLALQQLSYYNRGNALYWLGEGNLDPDKKMETWKKAAQDFESSLKLNKQDADARYNYDFVKKKLEELKQQQQQQKQSDQKQNQDQNKDQKNDQNQQSKNDQQKQQQNQQQQPQAQQNSEKNSQQNQQQQQQQAQQNQQKDQQQQQQQQQQQKQASQQKQQADQKSGQQADDQEKGEGEQAQAYAPGQMTPEQAKQLLDSQKGDEQVLPPQQPEKQPDRTRPFKDW